MSDYRLPPVLACGFVEIKFAHKLSLCQLVHGAGLDDHVSLTFFGRTSGDEGDLSLLSIQMYRLPKERRAFDSLVAFFSDPRKKRARLPEGVYFEPTTLAPTGVPPSWKHDGFPRSGHDIIHAYASDRLAMLIRYRGKKMIDNDLFRRVNRNLRVVEEQWETRPPQCELRAGRKRGATERPLSRAVAKEISAAIARAHEYLKLTPGQRNAHTIRREICDAVDRLIASKKRVPAKQAEQLAIDLGCLWGQALCDSLAWEWCNLKHGKQPATYAIVNPDRSYTVAPMAYMSRQISQRGVNADNTTLLLFNMIEGSALPNAVPGQYMMLG